MYKNHWKRDTEGESTIDRDEFIKLTTGLWKLGTERDRSEHPCPFPITLPLKCINMFTYVGDVVLDPFVGSGTTLRACEITNRKGIGIEINPDYEHLIKRKGLDKIEINNKWNSYKKLGEFF